MKHFNIGRIAIPLTIVLIICIVAALGGWYLYLGQKRTDIATVSEGRGLGETLNSSFPIGSAYQNVVGTIGQLFGQAGIATNAGEAQQVPQLWRVASARAAGIGFVYGTSSVSVRFIDRASGNVFDANLSSGVVERRSNTLLPKIVEAHLVGSNIITRSSGTAGIDTFFGNLKAGTSSKETGVESAPGEVVNTALPRGLLGITPSPRVGESRVFYLAPYEGGVAGVIAEANGSKPQRIWTFPITEWTPTWVNDHIILVQKASGGTPGSAYQLSLTGTLTPLIGSIPGLSLKEHPRNRGILYSSVPRDGSPALFAQLGSGNLAVPLPFSTFADKCTWDPSKDSLIYCAVPRIIPANTILPDAWYRGELHFSDAIWKIDVVSGSISMVYDPERNNTALDILDPVISADGMYMTFIDSTTETGWILRLQ